MFSMVTVASSTRMPTDSARPPRVMMLMVSPNAARQATEVKTDRGMEMVMIRVLRQLPRNSKISKPGERGGDDALADHPADRGTHENGLIAQGDELQILAALRRGRAAAWR